MLNVLNQLGATRFDLRIILQKRENFPATSNKLMCETKLCVDSQ